jgi:hypothetical protein
MSKIVQILVLIFCLMIGYQYAEAQLNVPCDGLLTIRTLILNNYVAPNNSPINTLVRANVSFENADSKKPLNYEDYWYADVIPIGCKRHADIPWKGGQTLSIRVKGNDGNLSKAEAKAAVDIIMRLLVQLRLKIDLLRDIYVPAQSKDLIVEAFARFNYFPGQPYIPNKNEPPFMTDLIHILADNDSKDEVNLEYGPDAKLKPK